jgi:dihydropteroate synthase
MFSPPTTLNCAGTLLSLETPLIMGILNVTPDSFYDGGRYQKLDAALRQAEKMLSEGASILDIGGASSRPGAIHVSAEEEIRRTLPVIETIKKEFPESVLSIDTYQSAVARAAVEAGAGIVNDISGGSFEENFLATVADLRVPYVLMHLNGEPKTMQQNPHYEDLMLEITDYFIQKIGLLRQHGVIDILLDPGFGFGKTIEHNYQLLQQLDTFNFLELPFLIGLSRKSMIYKLLDRKPEEVLAATSALHLVALQKGAKLLRVHDVREAMDVVKVWESLGGSF